MSHDDQQHAEGNLRVAFLLNLVFTIIEIIGGLYTNSLAILSDALHDLGDSFSLGLSWYLENVSKKAKTRRFSYGYRRFSLLGAVINSIVLVVGSIIILSQAVPQLIQPQQSDARGMMYLAILGIVVNGTAVLKTRKGHSLNERVVSLHLLEDVLGWLAVLIGSIIMLYVEALWIDPFLSVAIALFIIYNVVKNLRKSLFIILQGIPEDVDLPQIKRKLEGLKEVVDVHDCHVWSLDGSYNIMTLHLVLNNDLKLTEQALLKSKVNALLRDESIHHLTIEFETQDEFCENIDC